MSEESEKREKMFEKIRGLLKKAEGTPYEEEAALFMQKAQELMLRYTIDEEALWANDPEKRNKIETINISIKDSQSGAMYKRIIVRQIAELNNCKMWYMPGASTTVVAGFPVDLVWVETLYTSILVQANFKMALAQAVSTDHHKTFKNNFWAGFSDTINKRLRDLYRKAAASVQEGAGGSTALVLVDRRAKVARYVEDTVSLRTSSWRDNGRSSGEARAQGSAAAKTTDISGGRRNIVKPKGQLGK